MNRPSFNVLSEPWIPVIRLDDSSGYLGILPCLEKAHELREIRDAAPIIEFGLYRLLVAFVLDALILANRRPKHPLDLKSLIKEGRFDTDLLNNYAQRCGDVFDLFHPERPFLQTAMEKAEAKPLAGVFAAAPSGTNACHWHHQDEDDMAVTPAHAARLLTTIAPFMTEGGRGLSPSINGAPAIYALPIGSNLFETIVLSIPCRTDQEDGDGAIAWRSKRVPGSERTQATTVEALTWQPRRIQLVPGDTVSRMKFEKGDTARLTAWTDASLAYRYDKDKHTPIRMRENRPLWRDAGALLLLGDQDDKRAQGESKTAFRRPDVVEHAFAVSEGKDVRIQLYGMRTDKMKVFEWAKAVLAVPARLGQSTRLGFLVQRELDRAEKAAWWLRTVIKDLYPPRNVENNKRAPAAVADRCERNYWQRLEPSFYPLMTAFAALGPDAPDDPGPIATTAGDWRDAIKSLASEQFEFAAKDMDSDSDALERQVRARDKLNKILKEVLS